ncbi:MAG: HYC_CC_PP family protein [Ferruginibacter sp.]
MLLLFVYGVTTVGASVHLHFCMNKFVGWGLTHKENSTCGKCGMKEDATKKGCCKDEHKQLKIENDQQKSTTASFVNEIISPATLPAVQACNYNIASTEHTTVNYKRPPPLLPLQKLHILYCTYRI